MRKKSVLLALCVIGAATGARATTPSIYGQHVLNSDPVAYYSFDEASGPAQDLVSGDPARQLSSVTPVRVVNSFGDFGYAVDTSAGNSNIHPERTNGIWVNTNTGMATVSGPYAVEWMMKWNGYPLSGNISRSPTDNITITFDDFGSPYGLGLRMWSHGSVHVSSDIIYADDNDPDFTQWHHFVFVDRNEGDQCDLYVDGAKRVGFGWSGPTQAEMVLSDIQVGGWASATYGRAFRGLIDEVAYYDLAGEEDLDAAGQTLAAHIIMSPQAVFPQPADGFSCVDPPVVLKWISGIGALSHDVYLGESLSAVEGASPSSDEYRGNQTEPNRVYAPSDLGYGRTYYWRIDEVGQSNTVTGAVWSFTTCLESLAPVYCPIGDLDGNCQVDIWDLHLWAGQWLSEPNDGNGACCADFDGGGVRLSDYARLAANWLEKVGPVVISELMASNTDTLADEDGEFTDWIEIYNPSAYAVDLQGWHLTDDDQNLTKWSFPQVSLGAGQYLIIFASEKDRSDPNSELHTNFKLGSSGEYLALVGPDGQSVVHAFSPGFPGQVVDVSYGLYNGQERYFAKATPGAINDDELLSFVADTKFSHDRGFYNVPFQLLITCNTPDATIYTTVNGDAPLDENGLPVPAAVEYDPNTGLWIDQTTTLRAAASRPGWAPSNADTQTYMFLSDVIQQSPDGSAPGPGWPAPGAATVNGQWFDYGMDPEIVEPPSPYAGQILDAMTAIPSISLVTDLEHLFGPGSGIYVNAGQDGELWERPVSVELLNPDGSEGFQCDAGVRIRGGISRIGENPKHSFRLFFRSEYGDAKLQFPLFGDEGADEFDKIDLRTSQNNSWSFSHMIRNTMVYDVFSRDMQREMGQPYTRSRYYHLYINGHYWGLYQTQERSEASYAETYFGGARDDYDVAKVEWGPFVIGFTDGNQDAYYRLWQKATAGFATDQAYYQVQGLNIDGSANPAYEKLIDLDNLIDYMISTYYVGDTDGPLGISGTVVNNFWGTYNRNQPDGWKFFRHDAENSMLSVNEDRTGPYPAGATFDRFNPQWLHQQMVAHPEYRLRFADAVHKYFFNAGLLTPQSADDLWMSRVQEIDLAIIGESARWGDGKEGWNILGTPATVPLTKADWLNAVNDIRYNYFPYRTDIVLNQFKNKDWYPDADAPVFHINDVYQHGGAIEAGDQLSLTVPSGGTFVDTLVAVGSEWSYLDDGSDQGTAWRTGPISWSSGYAQLGYGDGDETTVVNCGPSYPACNANNFYTTYFRKSFTVADATDCLGLTVSILCDDGAVVYLNGVEIVRTSMPDGDIYYDTPALSQPSESTFSEFDGLDAQLLADGENILAVEVHQYNPASSDVSFDMEFKAEFVGNGSETVYYTLDGSDPRQRLTGNPAGTEYVGPISLYRSTRVKARTLIGTEWSALNEAVFAVGPVAQNLRITEIMYHPADVPAGEPNTEFIELRNIGPQTLNLNLVSFTNGIDFTFPDTDLAPGAYTVVVKDVSAFEAYYGGGIDTAGQYTGSLDNGGERIVLTDALAQTILDFRYDDDWYPITDGYGFSLAVIDPNNTDPNQWGQKSTWRPSALVGGSPGGDDAHLLPLPGAVVVNEVLAHSDGGQPDWIELHNTTDEPINIGGWFLSDSDADDTSLKKYQIAAGITVPNQGYVVFYENVHFGNPADPGTREIFALSENGDEVVLSSADGETLTGYREVEDFGPSETGIALGRYVKSTGAVNFVAMSSNTPGSANAYPRVGPVVISEINYHPPTGGIEFVELRNITAGPITLEEYDPLLSVTTPWTFTDGIDFDFPLGLTIPAGGIVLVVNSDETAFRSAYPATPAEMTILGPFANDTNLSNGGERLQLGKPGDVDDLDQRLYIRMDRVVYSDGSHPEPPAVMDPWPTAADGAGPSLHRDVLADYGNDVANWQAATPTPGQ